MTFGRPRLRSLVAVLAVASLVTLVPEVVGQDVPPASAMQEVATADPLGDFEAAGTAPQGWSVSAPSPNVVAAIGSRAVSGSRSLLVRDPSGTLAASATRSKFTITPGLEYVTQAYAFTTLGTQVMSLDFFDAQGARVARQQVRTPGAHSTWSRITVSGVAPATARSATVQVSSGSTTVSEAWWDGVQTISPTVPNASFEDVATSAGTIPGWYTVAGSGTTVAQSTAYARSGRRSLLVTDGSSSGSALVQTARVPVMPAVAHDVRLWIRPVSGTFSVTVKWFTASNAYLSTTTQALSYSAGDWRLVNRTVTAPADAARAVVQLTTRSSTTSQAAFDVVSLRPSAGAPARTTTTASLGSPLTFDNTNAVEATVIGGRPKLYTVVSGYPAAFQVVDVQTNTVEVDLPFPDPNISQTPAMTTGADGRVYLGTLGGRLWRWTPGATALEDLGHVSPDATAVWDLETAPDGRVWGGTSPDGVLFVFDPARGAVTERVQVSAAHSYVRSVAVDDEFVYAGASPANPTFYRLRVADLADRTEIAPPVRLQSAVLSELEVHDRYLSLVVPSGTTTAGAAFAGSRYLYDLQTGSFDVPANVPGQQPSDSDAAGAFYYVASKLLYRVDGSTGEKTVATSTTMVAGRDRRVLRGTLNGAAGEWLLAFDPAGTLTAVDLATYARHDYPITFRPTASRMKSMTPGPDGKLYVGGYGGASLAVVDPVTGAREQYPSNPTAKNVIGEVEGMIANDRYMFLGTYTGGKIFRYDTTQPWVDGTNPALVADLSSAGQDRPQAWATAGSRTFFGTVPKYGQLGGDLGIIDTPTSTPRIVDEPVTGQSVVSLAASGDVVYGGTSRWGGLGSTPTQPTARLFAYDAATGRELWETAPLPGVQSYGALLVTPQGELWAAAGPVLHQIDRATGRVLRSLALSTVAQPVETTWRNVDLEWADGVIYLSAGSDVYTLDPLTLRVTKPAGTTTTHRLLAPLGGAMFYPNGTELMRITVR